MNDSKILTELLRVALGGGAVNEELFAVATEETWTACHRLAVHQGVMALAWDGVQRLPSALQPPRALKINWALAVERYEKRYAHYCRTVHELSGLFRSHGIGMVQLKGVGFSANYPVPSRREGGDIDIYLRALPGSGLTDEEAFTLGEKLMEERGVEIDRKHSEKHNTFSYNGILIENHKTLLNVSTTPESRALDVWLMERAKEVGEAQLLDGECPVSVPSDAFNAAFIVFHAAQHYIQGLSLHHLCDWHCMLLHGGADLLPRHLIPTKTLRFIDALSGLCHTLLGNPWAGEYDRAFAEEIWQAMLHLTESSREAERVKGNLLRTFVYKWRRMWQRHRRINRVFDRPFRDMLLTIFKNNYRDPARLFRMTGQ